MNTPGYESLANILERAYGQAAHGKGAERHACQRPFTEQPMQTISELLQSPVGLLYQAMKKIQESQRLDKDAGVRELLGAINYIAGAIIFMETDQGPAQMGLPLMSRFDEPEDRVKGREISNETFEARHGRSKNMLNTVAEGTTSTLAVLTPRDATFVSELAASPPEPNEALKRAKVNFIRHDPPASWVCTDQGNHKPEPVLTGNACTICFAPSPK